MGKRSLTGVFCKIQKLRKCCEFRYFWDPAEICRKLPENYTTARKIPENYAKNKEKQRIHIFENDRQLTENYGKCLEIAGNCIFA